MIPPLLAIFSWPLVGWALFRKLPLQHAVIWVILLGYLFLPRGAGLNLPVLPTISKSTMPSLVALAMVLIFLKNQKNQFGGQSFLRTEGPILPGWLPKDRVILVLFVGLFLGETLTVLTNGDRLTYGPLVLPALTLYDIGNRVLLALMAVLPLVIARKCLATPEQHKILVFAFLLAGLIYTLPTLWEVRMSPRLSEQIYGMGISRSWVMHVRNGGFRPIVFLGSGLWVSIFLCVSAVAAIGYIRIASPSRRVLVMFAVLWLFMTLVLMNSLGGLVIAVLLGVPMFFATVRLQMWLAAALVAIILMYPMLRGAGVIPVDSILNYAESFDERRAQSLGFRLRNEDLLLEKAQERPLFGWGSWARNQVYDENGRDISVTDGAWVILIGSNGWIGYIAKFGLLTIPIIILALRRRRYPSDAATATVAIMLGANMFDLIPNATLTPATWLLAGALIGRLEYEKAANPIMQSEQIPDGPTRARNYRERPAQVGEFVADGPAYSRQKTTHTRRKETR